MLAMRLPPSGAFAAACDAINRCRPFCPSSPIKHAPPLLPRGKSGRRRCRLAAGRGRRARCSPRAARRSRAPAAPTFRPPACAVRKAAESGSYDAIVAAGGDGTIRHAAAALIGTDMALGIIPVGTGNVLAHEIGLARTPAAIARMLLRRARRQGRLRPGQRRAVPADGRRRLRRARGRRARPAPEEPRGQGGLRRPAASAPSSARSTP